MSTEDTVIEWWQHRSTCPSRWVGGICDQPETCGVGEYHSPPMHNHGCLQCHSKWLCQEPCDTPAWVDSCGTCETV
jgi:hypothetical protein